MSAHLLALSSGVTIKRQAGRLLELGGNALQSVEDFAAKCFSRSSNRGEDQQSSRPLVEPGMKRVRMRVSKEEIDEIIQSEDLEALKNSYHLLSKDQKIEAMSLAISLESEEIVRFFAMMGVDVHQPNSTGETPLQLAFSISKKMAKILVDEIREIHDEHVLCYAMFSLSAESIELALDRSVNISAQLEASANVLLDAIHAGEDIASEWFLYEFASGFKTVPYLLVQRILKESKPKLFLEDLYDVFCIAFEKKDEKLLEILRQTHPGQESDARAYHQAKWMSHIFSIDGEFAINQGRFPCDGLLAHISLEFTAKAVLQFLENPEEKLGFALPPSVRFHKEEIHRAITNVLERNRTSSEIVRNIQNGNLEIIFSGWIDHTIVYVFYKGLIIRCNRGGGSGDSPGVEIFTYDSKKLDTEVLEELVAGACYSSGFNPEDHLVELPKKLSMKTFLKIGMKGQQFGTCSWTSAKASFYAILLAFHLPYDFSDPESRALAETEQRNLFPFLEKSVQTYKRFTKFCRIFAIKEFKKQLYASDVDWGFLSRLEQKLSYKARALR